MRRRLPQRSEDSKKRYAFRRDNSLPTARRVLIFSCTYRHHVAGLSETKEPYREYCPVV